MDWPIEHIWNLADLKIIFINGNYLELNNTSKSARSKEARQNGVFCVLLCINKDSFAVSVYLTNKLLFFVWLVILNKFWTDHYNDDGRRMTSLVEWQLKERR